MRDTVHIYAKPKQTAMPHIPAPKSYPVSCPIRNPPKNQGFAGFLFRGVYLNCIKKV